MLLADLMTCRGEVLGITRHGLAKVRNHYWTRRDNDWVYTGKDNNVPIMFIKALETRQWILIAYSHVVTIFIR